MNLTKPQAPLERLYISFQILEMRCYQV